jgi:hypothetical protein
MEARGKTLAGRPAWENPGRKLTGREHDRASAAQPQLEEFDWESLRRVWEDEPANTHEERADHSLQLLESVLASRRRNRRLLQVAGLMLVPLVIVFAIRGLRQVLA